jgi:hypothetical protein
LRSRLFSCWLSLSYLIFSCCQLPFCECPKHNRTSLQLWHANIVNQHFPGLPASGTHCIISNHMQICITTNWYNYFYRNTERNVNSPCENICCTQEKRLVFVTISVGSQKWHEVFERAIYYSLQTKSSIFQHASYDSHCWPFTTCSWKHITSQRSVHVTNQAVFDKGNKRNFFFPFWCLSH